MGVWRRHAPFHENQYGSRRSAPVLASESLTIGWDLNVDFDTNNAFGTDIISEVENEP